MLANNELRILQYNLHKSKERTHSILNNPDTKQYAILLLQEQYWSAFTKSSPIHHAWTLYEPTTNNNKQPRTAIYVNKFLTTSQITLPLSDITAIQLTTEDSKLTLIINIYKPCDKNIIPELQKYIQNHLNKQDYETIIIVGDFNSHHPLWNPAGYTRHDEEADTLIEMMTELELNPLLPPGTITYPHAGTAIDLVWGNDEAKDRIIKCQIAENHDHGSDHLPIEIIMALQVKEETRQLPPYNYAKTKWKQFNDELKSHLPSLISANATERDIDQHAEELVKAITKTIQATTPRKKPCPHSKRWWNEKLTKLRREANRLRNVYRRTKHEIDKAAWRAKANKYASDITRAKETTWKEFVNNADGKTIWQIKKYIDNIPTSSFVPTLEEKATTNEQKVKVLQNAFFPPPPSAKLADIHQMEYSPEAQHNSQISIRQIREAINQLTSDKAPGPDEITNRVLKHALPVIENHLQTLMQASINRGYFPKSFKITTTVVLRKPGKPDYTKAKAYRPIALENTLGKVMESIMASIMSYLTETHELLPAQHYGGRPGRSAEDAMMILTENIYNAWKKKKIYTTVFMDVAGAFNNVHHDRLIHNLRTRHMPEEITRWIHSFLQARSTHLQFNGIRSERIATPAGVPQGSPLSPLLYMYYNADLLDMVPQDQATSLGFIDDIMYGVQGSSDHENADRLEQILQKAEEWREKHGAQFETSKYVLVHFTRNRRQATKASVTVNKVTIKPSSEAKYLGVIFDQKLLYKAQLQHVTKKGTSAAMALARITKDSWGAPYKYARQLFNAVIAARTDYAASIWHRPRSEGKTAATAQIRSLTTVQRLAMKTITGCYRTTPTAAMEVEAGLQPAWIRLQTKALQSVARMQSLSAKHPIQKWLENALRTRTAAISHRSNLENILHQFPHMATRIESIEPYIRPPWWESKVQIKMSASKKEAKTTHDEMQKQASPTTMSIYTDGSGIEGKVGAAAYNSTTDRVTQQHLGSEAQYNVFTAEVAALVSAAEILQENKEHTNCHIYTDSQAAAKAIDNPRRQSGQSIIKEFLDRIDDTINNQPKLQITIIWIPGHEDIDGNERADAEAKMAAMKTTSNQPFKHKPLKSARARTIKEAAKNQWQKEWNEGTSTAMALRRITRQKGVKAGLKLYDEITSRNTVAKIVQLRTGHCGLNRYLHRFGLKKSPYCECGYGKETVEHFLLECRKYRDQRKELKKELRREEGWGQLRIERLLGDPKAIKHTMKYIKETKRLEI